MKSATEAGKHAMATFAQEILRKNSSLTSLKLWDSSFESSDLEAIRVALFESNIRSLTSINLDGYPALFDTEGKC